MSQSLIIKSSKGKHVSAEVAEFNKLISKIEKLKEKNLRKKGEIESCLEFYAKDGILAIKENQIARFEFIRLVMKIFNSTLVLSKRDEDALMDLILYQFSEMKFYEHCYLPDGFDALEEEIEALSEPEMDDKAIQNFAKNFNENLDSMGIELDFDIEELLKSGAKISDVQERVKQKLFEDMKENKYFKDENKSSSRKENHGPKSKKQTQIEQVEKNLNDLFRQLARAFHPDLETDETMKEEKQELMKELNNAYQEKNIFAMLQMEIRWLSKSSDRLEKLSEEKLKIFILSLKEQIKILNTEYRNIALHPRFHVLQLLTFPMTCDSINVFYYAVERLRRNRFDIERSIDALGDGLNKKRVKEFIKEVHMINRNIMQSDFY